MGKKEGFLGVTFDQRPTGKNWKARVNFKGMCVNLGRFTDAFSAQLAYDQAVHILRPGGKTNFPIGQYPLDNADVAARIKVLLPAPHPSLSESSSQTEEDSRQPALKQQQQQQWQYQQHQQQYQQQQQQQQWQPAMPAAAAGNPAQASPAATAVRISSLVQALGLHQWQQQHQQQPDVPSRPQHGSPQAAAGGCGSPVSVGGAPAGGSCSSQAAGNAAAEPHQEQRALGLGVSYEPRPRSGNHYKARISHRGHSLNLGRFADAEGARQAYDQAAMVLRPRLTSGRLNYPQHQSHSQALNHVNPDVARRLSDFLASLPPEEETPGLEAAGGGSSYAPAAAAAAGRAPQPEEQQLPLQAQLLLQLLQHHISSQSAARAAAAAAASDQPGGSQPNQQKRQHGQLEELQPSSKRLQVAAGVEEEGWAPVAEPEAAGPGDGASEGPPAFHVVYVPHALMARLLQASGPAPEAARSG